MASEITLRDKRMNRAARNHRVAGPNITGRNSNYRNKLNYQYIKKRYARDYWEQGK
jgi:hypothetical protein